MKFKVGDIVVVQNPTLPEDSWEGSPSIATITKIIDNNYYEVNPSDKRFSKAWSGSMMRFPSPLEQLL